MSPAEQPTGCASGLTMLREMDQNERCSGWELRVVTAWLEKPLKSLAEEARGAGVTAGVNAPVSQDPPDGLGWVARLLARYVRKGWSMADILNTPAGRPAPAHCRDALARWLRIAPGRINGSGSAWSRRDWQRDDRRRASKGSTGSRWARRGGW